MKYRELLRLYKEGKLDDETRKEIEETLEKEDAIMEYLFEDSDIPELEDESFRGKASGTKSTVFDFGSLGRERSAASDIGQLSEADRLEEKFKQSLQKSIRRAFTKMGVTVGAVLLSCLLLIEFVLPHVVDCFYYDPGEIAARYQDEGYDMETNRMSLDMAVYTELFLPERTRNNVNVIDNGYGSYDITITQNWAYSGYPFVDVGGRIEKGKLVLYDTNTLKLPVDNVFEWGTNQWDTGKSLTEQVKEPKENADGTVEHYGVSAGGTPEEALESIKKLEDDRLYLAYVSLDRILPYETLVEKMEAFELSSAWYAARTGEYINGPNLGFCVNQNGSQVAWDNEKYPMLRVSYLYGENEEKMQTAQGATQHLSSMLDYLGDQKRFCSMMELKLDAARVQESQDYLQTNGLNIYGFAVATDKKTMVRLMDMEEVYSIYVEPIQ
ncbi:MAG: anti-sigma factor C-terminal domain-containing protein [Lachnospiraceae bacterium]|nr:anti-sigma factor C-terminal domain-containing protein [Lachnospiraceae bacterium]